MNKAVFLDRDGVINVDHGYVHKVDDFEYIEGIFEACKELKELGYKLVVVTNQSGIARGLYSEDDFHTLTEWMDWNFVDKGVELDGIYYCPHHPVKGIGEYKQDCKCRKPKSGMLESAASFLDIDFAKSVMVGDKHDDMLAALNVDIPTRVVVKTGKGEINSTAATNVINSIADLPKLLKNS